jgi:signal transduction histidine kinase
VNAILRGEANHLPRFRAIHKDGTVRWLRGTTNVVRDDSGEVVRVVGLNVDITETVQAEVALQESLESAVAASQAKSAFLAKMSHELRTPLNAIIGFSDVLNGFEPEKMSPERVREYSSDIRNSAHQLLAIVNQILDMSRVEAGEIQVCEEEVCLAQAAQDVAGMFKTQPASKNISLDLQLEAALPRIVADRQLIRQALVNLIANAVKFSPEGEKVTISAQRRGYGIQVAVEDRGPGIEPHIREQLFVPFCHSKLDPAHSETGLGLGLAITKKILDRQGIGLSVDSARGNGTTACLTIPSPLILGESCKCCPQQA